METILSIINNAFAALTGMEPTLMNFTRMTLATGFALVVIFYVIHVVQRAVYRSMSKEERRELAAELHQRR